MQHAGCLRGSTTTAAHSVQGENADLDHSLALCLMVDSCGFQMSGCASRRCLRTPFVAAIHCPHTQHVCLMISLTPCTLTIFSRLPAARTALHSATGRARLWSFVCCTLVHTEGFKSVVRSERCVGIALSAVTEVAKEGPALGDVGSRLWTGATADTTLAGTCSVAKVTCGGSA